jgi:hypothetical protein
MAARYNDAMDNLSPIPDTTRPTPLALSLDEIVAIPPSASVGLAKALIGLKRFDDALACALAIRFEQPTAGDHTERSAPRDMGSHFTQLCDVALASSPEGVGKLMSAIRERAIALEGSAHYEFSHAMGQHHLIAAGEVFERVARTNRQAALDMLALAPTWACLHHQTDVNSPSSSAGLGSALRGEWPIDVAGAYFGHDRFCARLVSESEPKNNSCSNARNFVLRALWHLAPQPGSSCAEALGLFVDHCIRATQGKELGANGASPFPSGWMAALVLGPFCEGRDAVYKAYGREACLQIARQEGKLMAHTQRAFSSGDFGAIQRAFECFGASDALLVHCCKLERSAVAVMALSMQPQAFSNMIDLALSSGARDALETSCAHRFWAVYEDGATVRKLGDALAFCAAQERIEHAEILLDKLPHLERKSVKEVLSYMNKRDAQHRLTAHSAWEALVLREICKTSPEPAAPARKNRL